MRRRFAAVVAAPLLALLGTLAVATPATAAVTPQDKLHVLSAFTQTTAGSYANWNAARLNPEAWAAYGYEWGTDYCSASPDRPLGFDFRLSCHRHDFGYRNYRDAGQLSANKDRIDSAFHEDLRRVCGTHNPVVRPVCYGLAWTYYEAVSIFGGRGVSKETLDRFAARKATAEANAAG